MESSQILQLTERRSSRHYQRPGGKRDLPAEACQQSSGFSLFQLGVPIAVSNITKLSDDGAVADISSMVPTDAVKGFHDCDRKDTTIEEYNLFAASSGTSFSFL